MIDGSNPCLTCGHESHPTRKLVVRMVETTHVGAHCFGCPECEVRP